MPPTELTHLTITRRTQRRLDLSRTSDPLDLAAKLRQDSVWPSVVAVAKGEGLGAPHVVELDPTSFCDLACPGCVSEDLLNQSRFTSERLRGLASELVEAGVRAVILIGGGEPLLHRAIGDVIETLGRGGLAVGLTTNGTHIDRYLRVIAEHVAWTRVSVDAATDAMYRRVRPARRGNSQFDVVIRNMRLLAQRRRGRLGLSFLLIARSDLPGGTNAGEILDAAELARDIGCDYFELKPQYDSQHFLHGLSAAVRSDLERALEGLNERATDSFSVVAPRTLEEVTAGAHLREPKSYTTCPTLALRTLITPSGAFVCPYHRGRSAARFGDPTTSSFAGMWNSDEYRSAVDRINPAKDCGFHCIRHQSNLTILGAAECDLPQVADFDPFI